MVKLDHTPRECLMYLRKLKLLSEDHKFGEGRKPPKTDASATIQDIDNHIRAAPAAWKRVERAAKRLNVSPGRPASAAQ